ncbi:hypothetical protein ACQP1G_14490 [Nocardia sp. CA-107356]|uniref:hypothetical protein n=1 Tax=Nocardia sp. CA-107356 TaxID=3239972 RepID=UPI003D8B3A56
MFDRSQLIALSTIAPLAVAALVATAGPVAADPNGLDQLTPVEDTGYLVDDPNYTGTVFFRTPDGRNCGFYPNGPAGCDAVPIDAPPGTNQVRSSTMEAAHYLAAEATFTYPGGAQVLPEGHKVTMGGTTCGVGYQGTVTCETGPHGFTIAATYGVLH